MRRAPTLAAGRSYQSRPAMNTTANDSSEIDPADSVLALADVNVHRSTASRRAARGDYVRVKSVQVIDGAEVISELPGVYVRSDATPAQRKQAILANAARIGLYIYKSAILYGDSAIVGGQHKCVLALATFSDIMQSPILVGGVLTIKAHRNPDVIGMRNEVGTIKISDALGTFTAKRFTDEYTFLSAFRKRVDNSTLVPQVSPDIKHRLALRLLGMKEEGDPVQRNPALESRLAFMASKIHITTDMKMVTKELNAYLPATVEPAEQRETRQMRVYWHDRPVGVLSSDGSDWEFAYQPNLNLKLSLSEPVGVQSTRVPNFMGAILPENSRSDEQTLEERMELYTGACRFISNISVHAITENGQQKIVPDVLNARINDFKSPENEFNGQVNPSMRRTLLDPGLLVAARADSMMPRISGMQVKLPCNLDRAGGLDLSIGKSFSHMVKVIGAGNEYSSMCSMEWFGLSIAKEVGIMVEDFAIADIGLSTPALIVERFDVRTDYNDRRYILAEDMWSVLGLRKNKMKYEGDLLDVARVVMQHSTDKASDATQLLCQSMVSWLMLNSDMHLKNLLMIKETLDPSKGFTSVRLSPAYDMMCTQVFPNDPTTAALSIGGNKNHTLHAFVKMGEVMGMSSDLVVNLARHVATRISMANYELAHNLPPVIQRHEKSVSDIQIASGMIDRRCGHLLDECDAYRLDPASLKPAPMNERRSLKDLEEHIEAERRRSAAPIGLGGEGDEAEDPNLFDASDIAPAPRRSRGPR